jgi:predicted secreted protein
MKKLAILALALLGVLLVAGLAAAAVTVLRMQDNGREIQVKSGDFIELALEMQTGTGYIWEFQRLGEKHFQVVHTGTKSLAKRNRMGGPMLQVWRLKALEPGDAALSLDYLRPWEGRAKAVNHFAVTVRIY